MEIKQLILFIIPIASFLITIIVNWDKIVKANWESLILLFMALFFIGAALYEYAAIEVYPEALTPMAGEAYVAEHPILYGFMILLLLAGGIFFIWAAVEQAKE